MIINLLICIILTIKIQLIVTVDIHSLKYPGRFFMERKIIEREWENYYECQTKDVTSLGETQTRRVTLKTILPGEYLKLACSPCMRPFEKSTVIEWRYAPISYLTEHGFHTLPLDLPAEIIISEKQELIFENTPSEFTGLYQCMKTGSEIVNYIVEVLNNTDGLNQVTYAGYLSEVNEPTRIPKTTIAISTTWSDWTECSQCGLVGKQYRYGICTLILASNRSKRKQADLSDNIASGEMEEISHNSITEHIWGKVHGGIGCHSQFLSKDIKQKLTGYDIESKVVMKYCKVKCPQEAKEHVVELKSNVIEKLDSDEGPEALTRFISENYREIAHSGVIANSEEKLIIHCPGWIKSNTPVNWKKGEFELIPEIIYHQSEGRFRVDQLHRLIIQRTLPQDTGVYSCWQWNRLVGGVTVYVRRPGIQAEHHLMLLFTLLLLMLLLIICRRIMRRRKQVAKY